MKHTLKPVLLALCLSLLAACSNEAVYTGESFATDSQFKMKVNGELATACESARRSLLGQGYQIEKATSDAVKGRKAYRSADNLNTFIEMNVVCLPDSNGSTLYANGVLSTYDLKKSSSSASVGVSAIGSISLPIGQSADSLVKISEVTIDDREFYRRFFAAVDLILGEMQAKATPAEAAPVAATAVPAPAPAAIPAAPEAIVPATAPLQAGPSQATLPSAPLSQPVPAVPVQAGPAPAPGSAPAAPGPVTVQVVPAATPEPAPPQTTPVTVPEELGPAQVPEGIIPAQAATVAVPEEMGPALVPEELGPARVPEELGPAMAPTVPPAKPIPAEPAPEPLPAEQAPAVEPLL